MNPSEKHRPAGSARGDQAESSLRQHQPQVYDSFPLSINDLPVREAALAYARMEIRVFPVHSVTGASCHCGDAACGSPGKHPCITRWPAQASADPDVVAAWWSEWPEANIGLPTGSAFVVVDIDQGGEGALATVAPDGGTLASEVESRTGSGGRHLFFRGDASLRNSTGRLADHVDIRGHHGYVVAPPSLHLQGGRYQWVRGNTLSRLPELPDWVRQRLRATPASGVGPQRVGRQPLIGVAEGARNDTLFRSCCRWRRLDLPMDEAEVLALAFVRGCVPPLPDAEARKMVARTWRDYPAGAKNDGAEKLLLGGEAVLDLPETVPAVWGEGDQILWSEGEPFYLAGPTGVGKTTLVAQVLRARLGMADSVLGLPVQPTKSRVLYVAADRPIQIRRALHRLFAADPRDTLNERLLLHDGHLPFNLSSEPARLCEYAQKVNADTVVIDSLKDVAGGDLINGEVGSNITYALAECVQAGIEVAVLHHQRKAQSDNRKPKTINDMYGSQHLSAGAGSIVILWGEAGGPLVELHHVKMPLDQVGPWDLLHDHSAGTTKVIGKVDLVGLAAAAPITAYDAAEVLFGSRDKSYVERARRKLKSLTEQGRLEVVHQGGKGTPPTSWAPPTGRLGAAGA